MSDEADPAAPTGEPAEEEPVPVADEAPADGEEVAPAVEAEGEEAPAAAEDAGEEAAEGEAAPAPTEGEEVAVDTGEGGEAPVDGEAPAPAEDGEALPATEGEEAPAAEGAEGEESAPAVEPAEGEEGAPAAETAEGEEAPAAEAVEGEEGAQPATGEEAPDSKTGSKAAVGSKVGSKKTSKEVVAEEAGSRALSKGSKKSDPGDEIVPAEEPPPPEPVEEVVDEEAIALALQQEAQRAAEQLEINELYEKMVELQEEFDKIMIDNTQLHRRVIQNRTQKDKFDTEKGPADGMRVTEHKYMLVLQHVHTARLKLRQQQVKAAKMSEELKNQLEEKRQKAVECRDAFRDFKRAVSLNAEYSRTGKTIPAKILNEIENFEHDKDAEVEEVRGSNISLKNRLTKLELQLRKKDELADNLHVIDFEQLKIENQTLNEKIEERNEELHKLRKKTVITVQVMTHMREKLQCIVQENQLLKVELQQLDSELQSQRDLVGKTKHERDDFRVENVKLKQQAGIINSRSLNEDYESRAKRIFELHATIDEFKDIYNEKWSYINERQNTPN